MDREWREVWRDPACRMPDEKEDRFVIVRLSNGYCRTAYMKDGMFMSGSQETAQALDICGWIPMPDNRPKPRMNRDMPPEVVIPYMARDLRKSNAALHKACERVRELEQAIEELRELLK